MLEKRVELIVPRVRVACPRGLDWQTVKALDPARLERSLGPVDLDGIEIIAMDEFAIQRGRRYALL